WWALSGLLATRLARHDEAAEYFATAGRLQPSSLLTLRRADALLESGRIDEAQVAYTAALDLPDAEAPARYGLGRVAAATGDGVTARTHLERALALVPVFGAAHYALAQLQRKAGDVAGARLSIERQQRCLSCWPMPPDPWAARLAEVRTDASAVLQRGLSLVGRAEDARVIAAHEQALARDPVLVQAHTNLITLYARTGNLAAAERHYQSALASGTHGAEAHRNFGLALLAANDAPRAEPVLRQAIDSNPHDAEALNGLGMLLEAGGRAADAEAMYQRAIAANPVQRAVRFNYARVLVAQRRYDEALAQMARLTTPDDAESARYLFAASVVHVRKGDPAQGRRVGEEALRRAREHGLADLAATIERDLAQLK
ncbi:MAG: tetratricopeptide repeat protein, partial [Luteitalea sp.]